MLGAGEPMNVISIDLETFSDIDLGKCGVYRYAESPIFDILLFSYSIDEGQIQLIDLASGDKLPDEIIGALMDQSIIKTAFNANFERVCLMAYLSRILDRVVYLDPISWRCSEVQAAMLGLPLHLEGVARVLMLEEKKMAEGKPLIRYFCMPCKPTAANGGRTRNLPTDAPEKWEIFKQYNIRDVEVELAIRKKLAKYPIPEAEQSLYVLDQKINDKGLMVDMKLVNEAISCDRQFSVAATEKVYELTGLANPNSIAQLKDWLADRGVEVESLSRKNVQELVGETEGEVEQALKLRLLMAKTSVKKYEAIQRASCSDNRVRGLFQFYGANRTGRFAGRLVQFQNLPQNHLKDLDLARELLKEGCFEDMELLFGNTPGVLSELIRTAFVPKENHRFIVADFSAIEARVISWLAGEKWRMDVFSSHGKIYEAAASQMFHIPIEEVTKDSPLRQKGKIAELACIAEGELVLTNQGLVPIEKVTTEHKLWDGDAWVSHDGVIYKGEQEVIEYEGLRATKDHLVWIIGKQEPVFFGEAATRGYHLMQTGDGSEAIRQGEDYKSGEKMEREVESLLCIDSVCKLSTHPVDKPRKLNVWKIKRLSELLSTKESAVMARPSAYRSEEQMRKAKTPTLSSLRRKRYRVQVHLNTGSRSLDFKTCGKCQSETGNRSDRQRPTLRNRKHQVCGEVCQSGKSELHNTVEMGPEVLALRKKCDLKETFKRNGKRVYYCRCHGVCSKETKELAVNRGKARVYDILNAGANHRFTVSGKLVHNCGFGGGVGALKAMGALGMGVEEHELQSLIDNWRAANPRIVNFWWEVDKAAITAVKERTKTRTHSIVFTYKSGMLFVTLPSGRNLVYVKPKLMLNKFGREGLTYEGIGLTKKWARIETYGAKIVENCLAGDALVLTQRGWIVIKKVRATDKVWDGEKWVTHDGLISKGIQETIAVDGVKMTSEHKVLTESGWIHASSCQGYNRYDVRVPIGYSVCGLRRKKIFVACSLRMWKRTYLDCKGFLCEHLVRLLEKGFNRLCEYDARHVKAPSLLGLAVAAGQMPASLASGVEKLRWSWDTRISGMGRKFRGFLERYGKHLSAWADAGARGRKRQLLQRELHMDNYESSKPKQAPQPHCQFCAWTDDHSGIIGAKRYRCHNASLSAVARCADRAFTTEAGCDEQVFDLKNCGDLHRFTVLGNKGAFIVHNCVQGTARDLLAEAMLRLDQAGFDIVAHVHDEVICEVPRGESSVEEVCSFLSRGPRWADGLALDAGGFECDFYRKE